MGQLAVNRYSDSTDIDELLAEHGVELAGQSVDLGICSFMLQSNTSDFSGYDYFARLDTERAPEYRLDCVDLDVKAIDSGALDAVSDRTFRAKRFATGFYLTHHYGAPAWIATRGSRTTIFGRRLEKIVWTYYVKQLLTNLAADRGLLHLKGAGFVGPDDKATLLFGRGGAGKTVFLAQACMAGMSFLTNTHVVIDGARAVGVPSALRVRDDACFGRIIRSCRLQQHLQSDEYVLNPGDAFPDIVGSATVKNLCIIDYRSDRRPGIRRLEAETFFHFLDQFAFPPSTYGLKDDLLAHVDGDLDRYVEVYSNMKEAMRHLVTHADLYLVNVDMMDPSVRAEALGVLHS
ncbi:FomB family phosphonate monophosphate kinase [Nocardia suismassiliense]|uniref:FomB family phosphonate monophosphate kinase n=1 Tax=Nocardia suismassiliense TaxID=2077092 RepID=UPI000D1EA7E0|nr:FomB family phosphonate monophosphate kinase [Nocardia suismassiliense]